MNFLCREFCAEIGPEILYSIGVFRNFKIPQFSKKEKNDLKNEMKPKY